MNATILSATTIGILAHEVAVEVDLALGLISFTIVGLPDKGIKESKERIRAALKNSGLRLPERAITVNLAPAHIKKENTLFDLPISLAILQAANLIKIPAAFIEETLIMGALGLNGIIQATPGILPIVDFARMQGKKRVIVPQENLEEACLIQGIDIIGVHSLTQLVGFLRNELSLQPTPSRFIQYQDTINRFPLDFSEVKGQLPAKRALQIAAAGRHNILFVGPPGSGKTMLAQRLGSILPPMSFQEVIETTKVYSVAGKLDKDKKLILHRPFRDPHHTTSQGGLVGGGPNPKPGEISLAHNGVLFLDELTEYRRTTLEVLRQPLESGMVLISRTQSSIEYPASFILVGALNPCPCGFFGSAHKQCTCSPKQILYYMGKISGPLLDRIDLHMRVTAVRYEEIIEPSQGGMTSATMKRNVDRAVAAQEKRSGVTRNAHLSSEEVEKYCILTADAAALLKTAFTTLGLSMRGYHKILKIARTIADLEQSDILERRHVQEAISYRSLEHTIK
jgi:magnesium chelatase family protein